MKRIKLEQIEAYINTSTKKSIREIFLRDDENDNNIWIKIIIHVDKDADRIDDTDYINVSIQPELRKAIYKIRRMKNIK
jgi:hypothetical protein